MSWLINGGYMLILDGHLVALIALTGLGILGFWKRAKLRLALGALSFLVLLVSALNIWSLDPRPAVYYDEFYYAATAQNMVLNYRVEPLLYRGENLREQRIGYPRPPYPVGWPHLISCYLRWLDPGGEPAWNISVRTGRVLHLLMPLLLLWALSLRLSLTSSCLVALMLTAIPAVNRLSQCGSSESGALFALVLTFFAWSCWRNHSDRLTWIWLLICAAWGAEMRPEMIGWVGMLGLALFWEIRLRNWCCSLWTKIMGLSLMVLLISPALAVLLNHPPDMDEHFQALPRAHMTMWHNRASNLVNNALSLIDNKIWPVGLTVLAVFSLAVGKSREKWFWMAGALALTLFFSWYPFGDFDCAHSTDAWRLSYHLILPALVLAGGAIESGLEQSNKMQKVLLGGAILAVLVNWWIPNAFLNRPHPLEYIYKFTSSIHECSGERLIIVDDEEFCHMLRYGWGLPAVQGPISAIPEAGVIWVKLADSLEELDLPDGHDWQLISAERSCRPEVGVYLLQCQ